MKNAESVRAIKYMMVEKEKNNFTKQNLSFFIGFGAVYKYCEMFVLRSEQFAHICCKFQRTSAYR